VPIHKGASILGTRKLWTEIGGRKCYRVPVEGHIHCRRVSTIGMDGFDVIRLSTLPKDAVEEVLARVRSLLE